MKGKCFIYGLRARDSSRYFYVGSTKISLAERWAKHREQIRCGLNKNLHFVRTVEAIGIENVVCERIEEVMPSKRFERESYWINTLPALTNIVKNPTALNLRNPPPSITDIEALAAKVKQRPDTLSQLTARYAESVVNTVRSAA